MTQFRDLVFFCFGILFMLTMNFAPAHAADRFSFDVNSTTLDEPFVSHPFYARADLVTYCFDHGMIFTSGHDACAMPERHACSIAYPVGRVYDWREVAAICNGGWKPRLKDWF